MDKKTYKQPTYINKPASACVPRAYRALCVLTLVLLGGSAFLIGCGKSETQADSEERLPEVYTDTNNAFMRDPDFRGALDNLLKERSRVSSERAAVEKRLEKLRGDEEIEVSLKAERIALLEVEIKRLEEECDRVQNEIITHSRKGLMKAIDNGKLVNEGKAKEIKIKDFK